MVTQLIYYLPSVAAHLVALVAAALLAPRARVPAALLATGTALQLLASCGSYGSGVWAGAAYQSGSLSSAEISAVAATMGVAVSLLRAVGELVVVGAVAAAVLKAARGPGDGAASGTDPYGFPEK